MSALAPPRPHRSPPPALFQARAGDTAQATPEVAAQPTPAAAAIAAQASAAPSPGHAGVGRWPAAFDDRSAADRGAVRRALHQQRSELAQQSAGPRPVHQWQLPRRARARPASSRPSAAPVATSRATWSSPPTSAKLGGPDGGGYGIIVRDQRQGPRDGSSQDGRYYVLEVGDKGEVGIWRRDGDHWVDLLPWQHSDAVKTGTAPNN